MESRRNTENFREWIWPYTKCLIPRNSWILDSLPKTNNLLSKMLVGRWFSFLEWSLFAGNIWIFVEIPSKILGQVAANALPGEPTGISDRKSCCRPCHVDSLHEDQQKKITKKTAVWKFLDLISNIPKWIWKIAFRNVHSKKWRYRNLRTFISSYFFNLIFTPVSIDATCRQHGGKDMSTDPRIRSPPPKKKTWQLNNHQCFTVIV